MGRFGGRVGVVNPRVVRLVGFVVITTALVLTALSCLIAIWMIGGGGADIAMRALGSFGIITCSVVIFIVLNEGFASPKPPDIDSGDASPDAQ